MTTTRTMSDAEVVKAVEKHGLRGASRKLNVPKSTLHDWVKAAKANQFTTRQLKKPIKIKKPRANSIKRFIFTSAQDGTSVFEEFWENLHAYADYLDAEVFVAGFTYNKSLFEEHRKDKAVFYHSLVPYMTNRRFNVGPGLVFCGEQNTLPTAVNPLSGFEAYTGSKWGIFPHAKVQMRSIATMFNSPAKIIMTTGTVTKPNYVLKKAGIKAGFHHVYGAVLVELLPDGTFFCRHLLGEKSTGDFYDLDRHVSGGVVTTGHRVAGINWGDIHWEKLDEDVAQLSFGYSRILDKNVPGDNLLDYLRPEHQFMHDLSDFMPRNHHNIKDPHFRFEMYLRGTDSVRDALVGCSSFLLQTQRPWCKTAVIQSNHDNAFLRWLKEADYKTDPVNARFFLTSQGKAYDAIQRGDDPGVVFEETLRGFDNDGLKDIDFVNEDQSYIICPEHGGGIECGMHGHLGSDGSRGSPPQFTKMGPKTNTGHVHKAGILDGNYTAGVSGELDQGYNKGPSSWSHSHIVTYANGKRAILTKMGGRFYAQRVE